MIVHTDPKYTRDGWDRVSPQHRP